MQLQHHLMATKLRLKQVGQNSSFPNFDDGIQQIGGRVVQKFLGDKNQRYSQNPTRGYYSQTQIAFRC